jgi:hypothetical protein
MTRTLAALAVLPLALAGAGFLRPGPHPAQGVAGAPVPVTHVPSNVGFEGRWLVTRLELDLNSHLPLNSPPSHPQEGSGLPGGGFLARFEAAYRGEEPPELAMRSAAVPVGMPMPTMPTMPTMPAERTRADNGADRADSRPGLCERHGLRKVQVSERRWRCRK